MKTIEIADKASGISAVVLPDYGGMLARLRLNGKDVFFLDEQHIACAPMLAGGCPVLFPFPSKTKDDLYTIYGKEYSMPFHGLVKNAPFAVAQAGESSVRLYVTNSKAQKDANYPFDFRLELDYSIRGDTVTMAATVHNASILPLPHYFGWHPYFTATDKAAFALDLPMREYIDFINGQVHLAAGQPDVSAQADAVYYNKTSNEISIHNPTDGYKASIHMDEAYETVTLFTMFDGCVCVEPWLGLPDSINTGKYVQLVQPKASATYAMNIQLEEI